MLPCCLDSSFSSFKPSSYFLFFEFPHSVLGLTRPRSQLHGGRFPFLVLVFHPAHSIRRSGAAAGSPTKFHFLRHQRQDCFFGYGPSLNALGLVSWGSLQKSEKNPDGNPREYPNGKFDGKPRVEGTSEASELPRKSPARAG